MQDTEYLTVVEVAKMLRVHKMTIYRLIKENKLPSVKFNSSVRIPKMELENYLKGGGK